MFRLSCFPPNSTSVSHHFLASPSLPSLRNQTKLFVTALSYSSPTDHLHSMRPALPTAVCLAGLLQTLMQGIQCHLDSSLLRVRRLGMIVGEAVTRAANTEGEPLTFEVTPQHHHVTCYHGIIDVESCAS